jgi:hypothetical protein
MERLGYNVFRSPGSRGVDLVCTPRGDCVGKVRPVLIEVGGRGKRIRSCLAALEAAASKMGGGYFPLVAICADREWRYVTRWGSYRDLGEAVQSLWRCK